MLGSMTHLKVAHGAIYTLNTWTTPAAELARQHQIELVNRADLSASAAHLLSREKLTQLLQSGIHHCPRCEAPMLPRTSLLGPFWGCSTFPRCRAKLKYVGAR